MDTACGIIRRGYWNLVRRPAVLVDPVIIPARPRRRWWHCGDQLHRQPRRVRRAVPLWLDQAAQRRQLYMVPARYGDVDDGLRDAGSDDSEGASGRAAAGVMDDVVA